MSIARQSLLSVREQTQIKSASDQAVGDFTQWLTLSRLVALLTPPCDATTPRVSCFLPRLFGRCQYWAEVERTDCGFDRTNPSAILLLVNHSFFPVSYSASQKAHLRNRKFPNSPTLFNSNWGAPISSRMLDVMMKTYGEKAKLPPRC